MTETAALQRLLTWLSPAFPVGAFAWSAGLETAIADGRVRAAAPLREWIEGSLRHGGMKTDAILLAQAHAALASAESLDDLARLALALIPATKRRKETLLTGDAFVAAARAWPSVVYDQLPAPCPYPIAVGAIAASHGIALADALLAYLTAAVHSQVSVAIRLVPLGQSDGLKVMASLEATIATAAAYGATATLDDIGGIAYAADIAQMRHEDLEPRIFRS